MCVICDRMNMVVVPISFDGIGTADRDRIAEAIQEAYEGVDKTVHIIDEYHNTRRQCPAYRRGDGSPSIVHSGHCKGLFEGVKKCPYYDGSKPTATEQCRYGKGRGAPCV